MAKQLVVQVNKIHIQVQVKDHLNVEIASLSVVKSGETKTR